MLFIPVILGSIRQGRRSHAAAQLLAERVSAGGHRTVLVDLAELGLPMYDEAESSEQHAAVGEFRRLLGESQASVWLTPEYNHGYTAAIKNAIDYLHGELRRKPALVCGLSGGAIGGARAVEQLKMVLVELHAVTIRESIYFADARTLFDDGEAPRRAGLVERIDYAIAELDWYAQTLVWGRDNVPIPQRRRT
jgi:NAD(P)H-dependent FMN reductase